jgi:hypothetical protein
MQPEDLSGSVPAGEERIPDSWVGRRVEAVVVRPVNPDQPGFSTSLTARDPRGAPSTRGGGPLKAADCRSRVAFVG